MSGLPKNSKPTQKIKPTQILKTDPQIHKPNVKSETDPKIQNHPKKSKPKAQDPKISPFSILLFLAIKMFSIFFLLQRTLEFGGGCFDHVFFL